MNEFFVDPSGLRALSGLLARASGDARDTLDYTRRHCELSWDRRGLLMLVADPHGKAYGRVTTALDRLRDLSDAAAGQVDRARGAYAATDHAAAATLDATYPGATDPHDLRGTLHQSRPDLLPARAPFADATDVVLQAPSPGSRADLFTLNPLTDLLSPAAWIRQVAVWLFGIDPFEPWLIAYSGDWRAYEHCMAAWPHIGAAATALGGNLVTGAADVSTAWRGNAAEAEQEFQLLLGGAATALGPACAEYARLYPKAVDACQQLYEATGSLIGQLIDTLIIVNVAGAVGTATIETGIGAVTGYAAAAYYTWQAYKLYQEISRLYGAAEITIRLLAAQIEAVQAGAEVTRLPSVEPYHHPAVPR
ncbi:type VII secretion target [Dactylosporangium sp. NPDC049525]|uniref:type VII secretion target n=1 Tax=Dactylosporangium sp. NPDC049525 TaxID=3154730 RepID=UPI00341CB6F9